MKLNKKGLNQLREGHPWLFDDMLDEKNWPAECAVCPIGEHWFLYSPKGKLKLRRLGPATRLWPGENLPRERIQSIAEFNDFFSKPLAQYLESITRSQSRLVENDTCFRWIFAENQGLPGLVVDVFESHAVAQIQSQAIEFFWEALEAILSDVWAKVFPQKTALTWILDRGSSLRKLEGLEIQKSQSELETLKISWNGLNWNMRPGSNQKTGAYLDQRLNHRLTKQWAKSLNLKSAWDLCCFEGGFGLHLAKAGLKVRFLDQSETALDHVRANLDLNAMPAADHEFLNEDVFDFLKNAAKGTAKADLIVLDPPAFTKSRSEKPRALRGYFELHRQALRCLKPESLLVTCSCSHHISSEDLAETLREAAHATRRDVRIIDRGGPSPDHGRSIGFPESEYLHALFALVL